MNLYADLLFTGGPVYTADPAQPWVEAVAVAGERILAAGSAADLAELRGPHTEVVDLAGKLLLPGFTESHIHFVELALRSQQVDVTEARSAGAVVEAVRARLDLSGLRRPDRSGAWLRGGGWNPSLWTDGVRPHRSLLDAVAPDVPVALDSKDLHSVWLNSAALQRAGVTAATADAAGGVIERDLDGTPTGILRENAVELALRACPAPDLVEIAAAVRAAFPALWSTGIVAIHNANDDADMRSFRAYQELRLRGELGLRVLQQIPVCNLTHARGLGLRSGLGDVWLRIGSVKMFADGALGSRTAHMLQPYGDNPTNWGVAATDPEELLEQALAASAAGLSLTIHAIGDRANRDVLDVLAEVRRAEERRKTKNENSKSQSAICNLQSAICNPRHRIEHVQCIQPADLPRLAALDVIASVQPIHCTSDMNMVDRYWGPGRAAHAYPFRSLLDSGARLVFGSDGPIEPHSPLIGIHAAVTRRRADGAPGPAGWQGQERLIVAEAVDAYTCWPAYAAGEESYRGSITAGKVADLVLLSQNIFKIDPMAILETQVEMTVLAGKVAWRGPSYPAAAASGPLRSTAALGQGEWRKPRATRAAPAS
ncbi:MAG: amidohydrolase [Chloroflexi bacterium]|nr:amidohydrolase [Chloroflexota bacterium]